MLIKALKRHNKFDVSLQVTRLFPLLCFCNFCYLIKTSKILLVDFYIRKYNFNLEINNISKVTFVNSCFNIVLHPSSLFCWPLNYGLNIAFLGTHNVDKYLSTSSVWNKEVMPAVRLEMDWMLSYCDTFNSSLQRWKCHYCKALKFNLALCYKVLKWTKI